jgi:hypothetical protein
MKKKEFKNMAPRVPISAIEFLSEKFPSANAGAEWLLKIFPDMYEISMAEIRAKLTSDEIKSLHPENDIGFTMFKFRTQPPIKKMIGLSDFQVACLAIHCHQA